MSSLSFLVGYWDLGWNSGLAIFAGLLALYYGLVLTHGPVSSLRSAVKTLAHG